MATTGKKWQYVFEAIGTHWIIDLFNIPVSTSKEQLEKIIRGRIEQFDIAYSRFRKNSLVTKMSKNAGKYELPEDSKILLETYRKFYELTSGKITPLIGQTMEQAGYDADYSLISGKITTPPTWEEILNYEYPELEISRPIMLDLGAAGKGYLVDIIGELLHSQGINSFCIDAGGDILYHNENGEELKVGLENPEDETQAIGIAKIRNQSLCASAGNRRKWQGFHHIIDPHTLSSPRNILGTWVIAETAIVADGIATCLFFIAPEKLQSQFNFEYLILYKDHSINRSKTFPAELFYK